MSSQLRYDLLIINYVTLLTMSRGRSKLAVTIREGKMGTDNLDTKYPVVKYALKLRETAKTAKTFEARQSARNQLSAQLNVMTSAAVSEFYRLAEIEK